MGKTIENNQNFIPFEKPLYTRQNWIDLNLQIICQIQLINIT